MNKTDELLSAQTLFQAQWEDKWVFLIWLWVWDHSKLHKRLLVAVTDTKEETSNAFHGENLNQASAL